GELVGTGTLGFTWGDSEISDTLTIGASSTVADGALSANVSLLGSAIEKGELAGTGTLGFTWGDSEISDTLTASNYLPLAGGTLTGALTLSADPTTALGAATKQYVDGGGPTIVRKTVDESLTNSATVQNDDELTFAIGANETYFVTFVLFYISDHTDGDLRVTLAVPSGATLKFGGVGISDDAATNSKFDGNWAVGTTMFFGGIGAGSRVPAILNAVIVNGGTAGNVTLQWAQRLADADATTVEANSYLIAHKE
ncbi:MAG: hypothetical protein WDZ40_03275, partial [Candidatus Spechtbacterales bacterium]